MQGLGSNKVLPPLYAQNNLDQKKNYRNETDPGICFEAVYPSPSLHPPTVLTVSYYQAPFPLNPFQHHFPSPQYQSQQWQLICLSARIGCAHHSSLCISALPPRVDMWQKNKRLHDEMSIKVNLTAKFTDLLCCNRTDETGRDMGRNTESKRWRVERVQADGDRESWPALGLIKLPLLALIQKKKERYSKWFRRKWSLQLKYHRFQSVSEVFHLRSTWLY